MTTFKMTAG